MPTCGISWVCGGSPRLRCAQVGKLAKHEEIDDCDGHDDDDDDDGHDDDDDDDGHDDDDDHDHNQG